MPEPPAAPLPPAVASALAAGSSEHYADAALYDHEYRRRRADVQWYRALCRSAAQAQGDAAARILELGCGSGRLLVPLVRDGHMVLGVDRSAAMLARCAKRLERVGAATRSRAALLRADFRQLPLVSTGAGAGAGFPLVLCPFNGFMHLYTREDVEQFLAQVRRLLAPDGLFAFDVQNPDPAWLSRSPERRWARTRFRHPESGARFIYSTNHVYDPATQIAWIRIYYEPDPRDGGPSQHQQAAHSVLLAHRQFYPAELEALLHLCGFAITYRAGGFDGDPLSTVSAEQVICARRR